MTCAPRSLCVVAVAASFLCNTAAMTGCAIAPPSSSVATRPLPTSTTAPAGRSVSAAPAPANDASDANDARAPNSTEEGPREGRLPRDVTPVAQTIDLDLDPRQREYSGSVILDVVLTGPRRTLWLHARDLIVDGVTVSTQDGVQTGTFVVVDEAEGIARIDTPQKIPVGRARVALTFRGAIRHDLEGLYGVKAEGSDGVVDAYIFSQFEALAAREAFPCFDEPAWKIPFSLRVTHSASDEAVVNTQRTNREVLGNGRIRDTFATTAPLPTYLLAFAVGPFDIVTGETLPPSPLRPTPLPLRALTVRGRGQAVTASLAQTAKVLALQEQMFATGYPYDKLDIVAVPDFAAGAMENAGLVTFRDSLLFVDDKSPIAAQKSSLAVIAHELAHQWFGNLVTMAWWDDLWLNEAFASWFEARTVQRLRPDFESALELREGAAWVMGEDALLSARRIREPVRNRGDIENAFDGITYTKGSSVIAMFEEYIDFRTKPGTFLSGVTQYLHKHRFQTGTTVDFLSAISDAAGFDIAPAFSTFLDQTGVPLVHATCDAQTPEGAGAFVQVRSERFLPVGSTGEKNQHWDIPICLSFFLHGKTQKRCALLVDGAGRIELGEQTCPKAIHPNADGGGYYRFAMPAVEFLALAQAAPTLTEGEKVALAGSLLGAWTAAAISFSVARDAAWTLASDETPSVAMTAVELLSFAREKVLVTEKAQALVDEELVRHYEPRLLPLGLIDRAGDTPRDRERRRWLFSVVVKAGGKTRALAAAAGRELFTHGTTTKTAQDLWPADLRAAVDEGHRQKTLSPSTWEAWLGRTLTERDPRLRANMLQALASTKDPALSDRALELVFHERLDVAELTTGIFVQASQRETRERAFSFVTSRWDDITKRLPASWRPGLATAFDGSCSVDDAARLNAFFAPKVDEVAGLERALAQALETIRLCAARKASHGDAIRATYGEAR
jgi:alanyl aminopeptidase